MPILIGWKKSKVLWTDNKTPKRNSCPNTRKERLESGHLFTPELVQEAARGLAQDLLREMVRDQEPPTDFVDQLVSDPEFHKGWIESQIFNKVFHHVWSLNGCTTQNPEAVFEKGLQLLRV